MQNPVEYKKPAPVALNQIRRWKRASEKTPLNHLFITTEFIKMHDVPFVKIRYLHSNKTIDVYVTNVMVNSDLIE